MLARTVLLFTLLSLSFPFFAHGYAGSKHFANCSNKHGATRCNLSAKGAINLIQTSSRYNAKNIVFIMNGNVKGNLRLHHSRINQKDAIKGEFILDNFGHRRVELDYHVTFKDKKGLVAQTKGSFFLNPGRNQRKIFSTIELTEKDMKNIDTYEIRIIESSR